MVERKHQEIESPEKKKQAKKQNKQQKPPASQPLLGKIPGRASHQTLLS